MYWKITADYLYDGEYITENRTGEEVGERSGDELLKVRLRDDDGELYYEALAEDLSLEELFRWAMIDSGCTLLQVKEHGKWVDTIG